MKKFSLILLTALIAVALPACDDSDGDYPGYTLITTVRTLDGGDYYFQRDNGETLYPSDKSRVAGFKPGDDNKRAIIWFNLLSGIANYDYNIALYGIDYIYCGTSKVVNTQEELDELANNPTSITPGYCNLTKTWFTLYVGYPVTDNSKHSFTLIVNNVEKPEESNEGYLDVELRHNADGDIHGYTKGYYISLDMTPLAEQLKDKKGVTLRILTQENGTKYLKFDRPKEK